MLKWAGESNPISPPAYRHVCFSALDFCASLFTGKWLRVNWTEPGLERGKRRVGWGFTVRQSAPALRPPIAQMPPRRPPGVLPAHRRVRLTADWLLRSANPARLESRRLSRPDGRTGRSRNPLLTDIEHWATKATAVPPNKLSPSTHRGRLKSGITHQVR